MLREGSQAQKATYCFIPFVWHSGKDIQENYKPAVEGGDGDCLKRDAGELMGMVEKCWLNFDCGCGYTAV